MSANSRTRCQRVRRFVLACRMAHSDQRNSVTLVVQNISGSTFGTGSDGTKYPTNNNNSIAHKGVFPLLLATVTGHYGSTLSAVRGSAGCRVQGVTVWRQAGRCLPFTCTVGNGTLPGPAAGVAPSGRIACRG